MRKQKMTILSKMGCNWKILKCFLEKKIIIPSFDVKIHHIKWLLFCKLMFWQSQFIQFYRSWNLAEKCSLWRLFCIKTAQNDVFSLNYVKLCWNISHFRHKLRLKKIQTMRKQKMTILSKMGCNWKILKCFLEKKIIIPSFDVKINDINVIIIL